MAAQHPTILAAQARTRATSAARQTAGQLGNPVLGYEVDNTPFPGGRPLQGIDREAMTTITLPLEPLYQRGARRKQADALVSASTAESHATAQAVSLDATRAFYRVAQFQVRVEANRDVVAWLDSVVAYNQARVREGAVAEADLIRSQLERDRTRAEGASQAADLARARAELAAFLGEAPSNGMSLRASAPNVLLAMPASPGTDTERPDVRAARERVRATNAAIGLERSMFLRQVGAMIGTKQTVGTTSMIAGLSLPLPLFDQNRGEVARATAERDAAVLDAEASSRMAKSQVSGAMEAVRLLTERASAMRAGADTGYLARADQARRIALGAYREGAVPLLQVLDAARASNDARLAYFDLLFAQHLAVFDLLYASGADLRSARTIDPATEK